MFAMNFRHFLFVFRNPDGSALIVLDCWGKKGPQLLPKPPRVPCERKLSLGVVHDDDMSHGRAGRASGDRILLEHDYSQRLASQRVGTSRADNACTDDRDIKGGIAHARMPMHRGSSGSR